MLKDKMCVGIFRNELMCRIDPELYEEALTKKGCHKMEFGGKTLKGFVLVSAEGIQSKKDFDNWINLSLAFNKKDKASAGKKKK